ncbi:hypothetical protein DPMN_140346, partial [Dreissena polymorpha]
MNIPVSDLSILVILQIDKNVSEKSAASASKRPGSSLDFQRNIGEGKRSLRINLHTSECNSCKMVSST